MYIQDSLKTSLEALRLSSLLLKEKYNPFKLPVPFRVLGGLPSSYLSTNVILLNINLRTKGRPAADNHDTRVLVIRGLI